MIQDDDFEARIEAELLRTSEPRALTTPTPGSILGGIELAALFVEKRLKDYVDEFGSTDPETGTVEFPGNGDEYISELAEIIEGIRALATTEGE